MKAFGWIVVGVSVSALVYLIVNAPQPAYSTGDPDVERAAGKTSLWGGKQRVQGAGDSLLGKAKQGIGELTGNESLADEGAGDQTAGALKDTVGKVAGAVGDTIHNLNQ